MNMQKGFTLIELMIVVAIVAILAAIAGPSYFQYIQRGKVQEATAGLAEARMKMEQFYLDYRVYDTSTGGVLPVIPNANDFAFATASTATTYTVTATGIGGMPGFTYTIDQANGKTSTAWGGTGATCWIMKKGDTC